MEIPSLTVMVPKTCGMAPAACSASPAATARSLSPRLHGVRLLYALATPTMGLSKSASVKPTARSIERFGARSGPWVILRLGRPFTGGLVVFIRAKLPRDIDRHRAGTLDRSRSIHRRKSKCSKQRYRQAPRSHALAAAG